MESSGSTVEILEALAATEPTEAARALDRLTTLLGEEGKDGLDLVQFRAPFEQLLRRRGYFVNTPEALDTSLREIADVGPGFDLYDLLRSLARYDALRSDCLRMQPRRSLPELRRFCPRCACGNHRKER